METCLAIFFISLVFAGLFQVSQIFAAKEILNHAAARGARARTVGLNRWMVTKCVRVGAIPNAGRLIEPVFQNSDPLLQGLLASEQPGDVWATTVGIIPSSQQYALEIARIPSYLAAVDESMAGYVLDYEDWDTIGCNVSQGAVGAGTGSLDPLLEVSAAQDYPLWVPLHEAFYAGDSVPLGAKAELDNHYPLYLDDMGW